MPDRILIAPSILAADFTRLGAQIAEAQQAGADLIHVDVMDGRFVPNLTMGPLIVEAARRSTSLPLDVHLMIVEPEKHIGAFVQAGADRITVHVETCPHLHRVVQQIREAGARPAVALNPHTPAVMVEEILPFVDMVLVMTVNPGFGGQQFIPETLRKIEQLHTAIVQRGLAVDIQVDGGIDLLTAPSCGEGSQRAGSRHLRLWCAGRRRRSDRLVAGGCQSGSGEYMKKASVCWLSETPGASRTENLGAHFDVFAERANATGAHILAHQATVFHHAHALDIRLELALGPAVGVAHIVPELRPLPTHFTLCHGYASPPIVRSVKQADAMLP